MAQRDIVVVGASAGGVDALLRLVRGFPQSLGACVFVVLHMPSDATSKLAEVLGHACALSVQPAYEGASISPGRVYVCVPDRHLLIERDRIRVTSGPKENRARPAIDVLFRSAAYHYGPRTIGVVLSGNLDDGTAGLWTIKDRGGIALVQSPEEALFPSMPKSAIAHVDIDYVLPVAQMPDVIASLTQESVSDESLASAVKLMETEISIAEGANVLQNGSLNLGPVSANTCPTCHGVLVRIQEGSILRYRCHTGHAFSLQTLLAQLDEEFGTSLDSVLRVIHERIFLLQELEWRAREAADLSSAAQYAEQVKTSRQWSVQLHEMHACTGTTGSRPDPETT